MLPKGFFKLISKAIYASVIGMLAGAFFGVFIVGLVAAAVIVLAGSSGMVIASLESARQSPNDFAALAVASLGGGAFLAYSLGFSWARRLELKLVFCPSSRITMQNESYFTRTRQRITGPRKMAESSAAIRN